MNRTLLSRTPLIAASAVAAVVFLAAPALSHAQQRGGLGGGGLGGGFTGGGFGGTSLSGGFGGFNTMGSSSGRVLGQGQGFRPANSDPFAATRGSFTGNSFGTGQFGQFGNRFGNFSGFGNNQFGNNRNMMNQSSQSFSRLPTSALQDTLRPLPPASPEIKVRLDALLATNSGIKEGRDIRLEHDGEVLVMRGTVRSEGERRMAESLLYLEPGVREVRNELTVSTGPPTAAKSP